MPRRFYELYQNASIDVAKHQTLGRNTSILAFERNGGLHAVFTDTHGDNYTEGPKLPLPQDLQVTLRRGYYAAISFMDFEVGRVLQQLEHLGHAQDTAVIFFSDRECWSPPVVGQYTPPHTKH
jgi:iduronate 2-sulfatase